MTDGAQISAELHPFSHPYDLGEGRDTFQDWLKPGPVFALPLRCLQAERHRNLFAAGRCIGVTVPVWDVTRVIPTRAVTGEAAGAAATHVTVTRQGKTPGVSAAALQADLMAHGAILDRNCLTR